MFGNSIYPICQEHILKSHRVRVVISGAKAHLKKKPIRIFVEVEPDRFLQMNEKVILRHSPHTSIHLQHYYIEINLNIYYFTDKAFHNGTINNWEEIRPITEVFRPKLIKPVKAQIIKGV